MCVCIGMRIFIIRHGFSMAQHFYEKGGRYAEALYYAHIGDARVRLYPKRADETVICGGFLKKAFNEYSIHKPPAFWVSQYYRTHQTLSGIFDGLGTHFGRSLGKGDWKVDPRLNEQSFGLLAQQAGLEDEEVRRTVRQMLKAGKEQYLKDPFSTPPLLGDSPKRVMESVSNFNDGTMQRDIDQGEENFVFVVHGAVAKAKIIKRFHLYDLDTWRLMETPNNCDVIMISGEPENWKCEKIYDGLQQLSLLDEPVNFIEGINRPTEEPPMRWDIGC